MQTIRVVLTTILLGLFGLASPFVNCSAPPGANLAIRTEDQLNMSNSISNLLLRNLSDVFGENDLVRRRAAIHEIFTKTQYSMTQKAVYFVAATRSTASRASSGLPTLTFGISQLPSPRKQATAGGSDG